MSVTIKSHILGHNMIKTTSELGGLGDKDESFVELLRQDDRKKKGV
jgi:hypothetical protein